MRSYFAYGSNLHPLRIAERIGNAELVATGAVEHAAIAFSKIGGDGSGKCTLMISPANPSRVFGAVYLLSDEQKRILDRVESLGHGYEEHQVNVVTSNGPIEKAFTYIAMPLFVNDTLQPFFWYRELVVLGARFHGFPARYIAELERHAATQDTDEIRVKRNSDLLAEIVAYNARPPGIVPKSS